MNDFLIVAIILSWIVLVVGGWLGWELLSQNGRLLLRLEELEKRQNELELGGGEEREGLPVGSEAPGFVMPDLAGEPKSLGLCRGHPLLLIFFNPVCGYCRELLPKLKESVESSKQKAELGRPPVLILSTGGVAANRQLFDERKYAGPVLLQKESEVAAAYQANGTPSGYLIDAEGRIASELAMGSEALLELLTGKAERSEPDWPEKQKAEKSISGNGNGRASRFGERSLARSKLKRDGLKAGTLAPDFRLPRLDGRGELALSDLRGRQVLLVFSSPGCGPCLTLAPQVEKFHRQYPELEVVMISKGEPKENRAKVKEHKLTFPIVLQQQWEISRCYAMFGTPIAYLIDETGVIAHEIAVGVEPILALMAKAKPTDLVAV